MRRIASSIVMVLLLSLIFISAAGEVMAAKVTVDNTGDGLNCEYEVILWYKDQNGQDGKTAPVYLIHGASHTFDSGSYSPYMLDGSLCMINHKNISTGRYLMRRWIDKISGDSKWKIEIVDMSNTGFNRK